LTTQQQLDVLDKTLDDEEDNEEVLNPRHAVHSGSSIQIPQNQRKYIEGKVPSRKLFSHKSTRKEKGTPLITKRRKIKNQNKLLQGKQVGTRWEGEDSVAHPTFFNSIRKLNKTDRASMERTDRSHVIAARTRGRTADNEELARLAREFFDSRASNLTNFSIKATAFKEINAYWRPRTFSTGIN
jgi:hypothetical protein